MPIDKPTKLRDSYDVVVIGGGPAGATAATLLQQHGHRCALLERTTFPRYHIGESLIPDTFGPLERLGLLPKLRDSAYPVKHSVRFVAADGRASHPFYFSETIEGERARTWQVERSSFDRICLDNAIHNGVEVFEATRVDEVLFEGSRSVGATVGNGGAKKRVGARLVIDASGRGTKIGSQLGLTESVPGLVKSSLWSYFRGGRRRPGIDAGETTIFHLPDGGWVWFIPLPDDQVSVGIVGSPEVLFAGDRGVETVFSETVDNHGPLAEVLAGADRLGPVRGGKRPLAYFNRQTCGDGWVMVGDARAFLDPIYSSGVFLAMASAERAADCAAEALAMDDLSAACLGRFETELGAGVEVIRRLIHAFYDPEFSFGAFIERHPEQRPALIDCLVGDVFKDMSDFTSALSEMTPPPPALG